MPSLAAILVTIKKFNIGTDRAPLPVHVEGEAQGVAAPQHQLADLVDVDVDDDVDVEVNANVDVDVDGDLVVVGVKFESTTKTIGFSYECLKPCPKLIILPYLL